jgi:UDP-glucose 4-epimerase
VLKDITKSEKYSSYWCEFLENYLKRDAILLFWVNALQLLNDRITLGSVRLRENRFFDFLDYCWAETNDHMTVDVPTTNLCRPCLMRLNEPRLDTLCDMKIIITGASGFLGSWLCRVLENDFEVIALLRASSKATKLANLSSTEILKLDSARWENLILQERPDVLILNHWWGVGNKYRNDLKQFDNVEGINRLAGVARLAGVNTLIGVGSHAEVGPVSSEINELTADGPTSTYGDAKVKTRIAIEESLKGSDVRFIWMRIFSTYGPLDDGSWLIPNLVDTLARGEVFKMTKGEQEWSYLHAYDLAKAFSSVIKDENISGIVNVGNEETISIREAAIGIAKILEKQNLLDIGKIPYRLDQVMNLRPLCETLTHSGWQPQISFEEGIKQTINWLQNKAQSTIVTKVGESLDFNLPPRF